MTTTITQPPPMVELNWSTLAEALMVVPDENKLIYLASQEFMSNIDKLLKFFEKTKVKYRQKIELSMRQTRKG